MGPQLKTEGGNFAIKGGGNTKKKTLNNLTFSSPSPRTAARPPRFGICFPSSSPQLQTGHPKTPLLQAFPSPPASPSPLSPAFGISFFSPTPISFPTATEHPHRPLSLSKPQLIHPSPRPKPENQRTAPPFFSSHLQPSAGGFVSPQHFPLQDSLSVSSLSSFSRPIGLPLRVNEQTRPQQQPLSFHFQ